MKINFYEICLSDGYSICIKGIRKPTIEEAENFLTEQEKHGRFIEEVRADLDEEYARESFDCSNIDNWPVFGM